jgi:S-formylglutathione hydrolase FrmB
MALLLLALAPWPSASANPLRRLPELSRVNRRLNGRVLDYTRNHGSNRRLWSPALRQYRDLYVYLPPGFDPCQHYPLMIWLHGFAQDEYDFLRDVVVPLDKAIATGQLPPMIIASPDGSLLGLDCLFSAGSFFINSEAGRFEDYLMCDTWNFLTSHFPIRPEPEAHVIAGVSMGGGAAFNKAIKYPEYFKIAIGVFPPLNLRWQNCRGRYMSKFDPCCWGWRTDFKHRHTVVARFYGVIPIHLRSVISPLYSRRNPDTLPSIIRNNPIEMLDLYDVRPGQLDLYVAYGGKDQFNVAAQAESFLYVARERGLEIGVGYEPNGKHDRRTAAKLIPGIIEWLGPRLFPYAPEHKG